VTPSHAAAHTESDFARFEGAEIGPYTIERLLSAGGSGVIFAARARQSGREVALKLLRGLHPEEQEGLRREIHVLSHLSHHGVVRVFGSGVHDAVPWYAMELIRGRTLAECWSEAGGVSLDESLRILRDLSETLSFLHGEGIVHRDLKPANVMLRAGQFPVLVDFGFAARTPAADTREMLERGGQLVGSLAYISPEQIRGEHVDARSDLYSLGCMLYEAAAGQPPFGSEGPNLLLKHLAEPRPELAQIAPSAPPPLCELVASLLAKDPRDRVGYAEDVAHVLSSLLPSSMRPSRDAAPAYLYRPHFVGRETILATFEQALTRAKAGAGQVLLVTGESGAGKTRLAQEMTSRAADRHFQVVLGNCVSTAVADADPGVHGAQLHPFAPLLRTMADCCRHEGADTTRSLFGIGARVLAPFEPSLTTVPGFDTLPEPSSLSGEAASARTLFHLQAALRAFAWRSPLLLVLDDLQWADEMTLSALRAYTAMVSDLPVVVAAAARSEEMPEAVYELAAWPGVLETDLERLTPREIASMVSDMLAIQEPPAELVAMLARESEGNPFFVAEYVRAAVAAGHLRRVAGRWQSTVPAVTDDERVDRFAVGLPSKLRELAQQRLERVPSEATPMLEAAAVLGRDFDAPLAASVAEAGEETRLSAVAALLRRKILEEDRGLLRFSHDKLREIAYSMIPAERRRTLHLQAARQIECQRSDRPELPIFYASLAHHCWQGGDTPRAVSYFELAGAQALERGAYRDAHGSLLRAAELDVSPVDAAHALRCGRRGRMLSVSSFGIGDLAAGIQHGRQALLQLGSPLPRSQLEWSFSLVKEFARRVLHPVTLGLKLPGREDGREETLEAALTYSQLATSFFFAGSSLRTLVSVLRALREGERAGADRAIVEACCRLGFVAGTARMRPVAKHYFARAHRGAERLGDPRAQAIAFYFEAMHGIGLGRWERTRELGDRAADMLDELGDAHEAEVARTIAAHAYFYTGDIDPADRRVGQVLATATRRGNAQHTCWGRFLSARSELVRGRPREALALARSAQGLIRDLPDALSNVMLEGTLAQSALHAGAPEEALAACQRLTARLARGESPATGQCLDGVGAAPDVLLCLREARVPQSELPGFELDLEHALAALRSFARVFPIARPAALRCRARLLFDRGRTAAARRHWMRSARSARRFGMRLEEARVHLDLARIARDPEARSVHWQSALALLTPAGCAGFAAQVVTASGGPLLE
jgi:tetratricopeptide (TPR) repeat protein/predicted Ser/Thr protein kinase